MTTKKIFYILGLSLLLFSCNDAIDIIQPGELTEEASFNTVSNLNSGLLGLYDIIDLSPEIQFNAVFTDQVAIGADNGGQGIGNGEYGFRLTPASAAPTRNWSLFHAALNSANRLLVAGINLAPEAGEEEELNNILGQIYAIRAFAHFQIISYFSTDYADDNALGGFLVDFVPSVNDSPMGRSTNGEIFTLIDDDLNRADNLLSNQTSVTFISKDFITALRARIAAYRENYEVADQLASELLTRYELPNREQYVDVFKDSSNVGVIFKLERTLGDSFDRQAVTGSGSGAGWVGANFAFVNATINGSPYYEMSRSLFDQIDRDDIRFNVLVQPTSVIDNGDTVRDTIVIGKYPGSETELMNDLKVFRAAEMLLIRAEAAAASGNINGGSNSTAAFLKQLRDARFGMDRPLPNFNSQSEAFGAILDERRVELAYEGHRWKDLKRLGQRGNRMINRDAEDCAVNSACELPISDHRFTMPIPLIELNANPVISAQQNPGYN